MGKKITVLDTDTYKVKVDESSYTMGITVDGKTSVIGNDICLYNPNTDFILEYKTKEFEGFGILKNYGEYGLELRVVKVDTKSTDLIEYIHRYKIERYESAKDIVVFKYNKETRKFSIICRNFPDIVFKLKDLKKS